MAKICLTMIVKNESGVMVRCMNSCRELLDAVCITDTGSTDNTKEVISQWCIDNKLPYFIHDFKFTTFGESRNESLRIARSKFPDMLYFLIDADMICVHDNVDISKLKEKLTGKHYLLKQNNGTISYYNTRLVGDGIPCECKLVTHEYWAVGEDAKKLEDIYLVDKNDGGCRADKYQRDERLILSQLYHRYDLPDHDRIRYYYYLAQTYRCLAQITNDAKYYHKAIAYYLARSISGQFHEEVYCSFYYLAHCYKKLGDIDTAIKYYIEAYNHTPYRIEPLCHLAKIYRVQGKNAMASFYAQEGLKLSYPKECTLVVNRNSYLYKMHFEMAIAGYYVEKYNKDAVSSYKYLESIIDQLPWRIKQIILIYKKYYQDLEKKITEESTKH